MISYPNAKINLGLNIVGKRPDGYHDIESVFYPVPLCDILEILRSDADVTSFHPTGLVVPGPVSDNLCLKAFDVFQSAVRRPLSTADIYLHKVIPMGSGLGGGSSDGAFTLKMINDLSALSYSEKDLSGMASRLGSDCPFFIRNQPAFAEGRGEILSEVEISLRGYFLALVIPPVHLNTAEAYGMILPSKPAVPLRDIVMRPVTEWKGTMINDFETPVTAKFPEIGAIKEKLYELGAVYSSMSGSGSAVYGLFDHPIRLSAHFPSSYQTHTHTL